MLDASTGDFRATVVESRTGATLPAALREELMRVAPRELLLPEVCEPGLEERLRELLPD